jgi:hypothetical protein
MIKHKYGSSGVHKGERGKFDAGHAPISTELTNFLREWLSKPMPQSDKKFALMLRAAGAK